jgi:hypothetical protein
MVSLTAIYSTAKGGSFSSSLTANAVASMQLGNGRWESTVFNSRLQPTQIAVGTVLNGTDKLPLNYSHGDRHECRWRKSPS